MTKEDRRTYLKTVGALAGGLAIGGAIGWFAKPTPTVEEEEKIVIGWAARTTIAKYARVLYEAAIEKGRELDVTMISTNATMLPDKQAQQIDYLLGQELDGMVCTPVDSKAIVTSIDKVNDAGLPIVCVDVDADAAATIDAYVSEDQIGRCKLIGDDCVSFLEDRYGSKMGKVLELWGDPIVGTAIRRSEGFHLAFDPHDDIEVIEKVAHWTADEAYSVCKAQFTAQPDIDAIVVANDGMVLGCVNALSDMGLMVPGRDEPGHVYMGSVDGEPFALELLREEKIDSDSVGPIDFNAGLAVQLTLDVINGVPLAEVGDVITEAGALWSPMNVKLSADGHLFYAVSAPLAFPDTADDPRYWGNAEGV